MAKLRVKMNPMSEKLIITTEEELKSLIKESVAEEIERLIDNVASSKESEESTSKSNLVYIEEASQITGLSPSTIHKKCHYGQRPYSKPKGTKRLIFRRDELLAFMESGKHEIHSEERDISEFLIFRPNARKL